jgi:hypothetical protein
MKINENKIDRRSEEVNIKEERKEWNDKHKRERKTKKKET